MTVEDQAGRTCLSLRTSIDPWGNPFVLVAPGNENYDFDVLSLGADGAPGGDQGNADITQ